MRRTTKASICILMALLMCFVGCVTVGAQETSKEPTEVYEPRYSVMESNMCAFSISGINSVMTATLTSQYSTSLKITMELQKLKSGVYKTIETYTETGSGYSLSMEETRLINALASYRLQVTFTAGSETVVSYAYP